MRLFSMIFILLFGMNLFAEEAKVKYMIGEVRVKQDSQGKGWTALNMQTLLLEKDIIRTGNEALCELELPDGSITKILANSILELRNFPDPADESMDLFTGLGKFFFRVKKVLNRNFKVSSPVAVAAIRGTEFLVVNEGDKTKVLVKSGRVDLSDLYMRQTVQINPGFKAEITAGSMPAEPVEMTANELSAMDKLSAIKDTDAPKSKQKESIDKVDSKLPKQNDQLIRPSKKPKQPDVRDKSTPEIKSIQKGDPGEDNNQSGGSGSGVGFRTGVTVGAVTIDGKLYNQIGLRPEFSIGKLGVALDLSFYIDDEGNIRDDNWNSFDDIIEKIYYVRWGHRNDPLYVKVGAIDNYRLGFGLLMNHYSNTVEYPDVIRTGVEFGMKTNGFGVDVMLNNINELFNGGGLMGARYSQNLMGGFQVGASVVFDRNQFKGLKDRDGDGTPDYLDAFPDNKKQNRDSDNDGIPDETDYDRDGDGFTDNLDLLIASGLDPSLINDQNYLADPVHWADEYLDPEPFNTNEADGKTQIALALDLSYPLLNYDYLKLVTYGQYANFPLNDGAWGITAPGILAKFAFVNAYAEYRVFSEKFLPEYFNITYELERATFLGDTIITKSDRLDEIDETMNGYAIGADFDLANFVIFGAEFQNMTSKSFHIRTFRSTLDLNTSFIPKINRAGAYYMQNNARELFKKTEGTILGYRLEYEISAGASLLLDYRITYRDLNGDGRLEPVRSTNIQTVMHF